MKNLMFIIYFSFLTFYVQGQREDFDKNGCSQELSITFLKIGYAEVANINHSQAEGHLNLILKKSKVWFKNKSIKDKSELSQAILADSTLLDKFDVVIGIDNHVRFELLSDVLCWLQDFRLGYLQYTISIGKVEIYHFD